LPHDNPFSNSGHKARSGPVLRFEPEKAAITAVTATTDQAPCCSMPQVLVLDTSRIIYGPTGHRGRWFEGCRPSRGAESEHDSRGRCQEVESEKHGVRRQRRQKERGLWWSPRDAPGKVLGLRQGLRGTVQAHGGPAGILQGLLPEASPSTKVLSSNSNRPGISGQKITNARRRSGLTFFSFRNWHSPHAARPSRIARSCPSLPGLPATIR
jgi:hypothetical protein